MPAVNHIYMTTTIVWWNQTNGTPVWTRPENIVFASSQFHLIMEYSQLQLITQLLLRSDSLSTRFLGIVWCLTEKMVYSLAAGDEDVMMLKCVSHHWPLMGESTGVSNRGVSVSRSFDVFFVVILSKLLNKQQCCWWFDTPWSLYDAIVKDFVLMNLSVVLPPFNKQIVNHFNYFIFFYDFYFFDILCCVCQTQAIYADACVWYV